MDRIRLDLLHTVRSIRARPAATVAMVSMLGLGLGLVAAMFGLADPFILRPLPYSQPSELASISITRAARVSQQSELTLRDFGSRTDLFTDVAAFGEPRLITVELDGASLTLQAVPVSLSFFTVLGLDRPTEWRDLGASAELPLVLVRQALPAEFRDRTLIGRSLIQPGSRTLRVNKELNAEFIFPHPQRHVTVAALVPLNDDRLDQTRTENSGAAGTLLGLVGRLRSGVTPEVAQAALTSMAAGSVRVAVDALQEGMARRVRPLAMGALSAGLLILLAAIANFGNLALARSLQRRAEFATREAIGASRRDIARLVLVELTVLTSLGLTAALGFAAAALKFATYSIPNAYTAFGLPRVTPRVVVFASIASVLVVVGGMIPMLIAKRPVSSTLIQESHTSESKGVRSWRFLMTMAQCAVTVLLLVGSSLLVRSEFNLAGQDIGMMGDTFVVTALYPSRLAGGSPQFLNEVEASIDRLSRLPGVAAVGATFGAMADNATVLGMGVALNGHRGPTAIKFVSTDYFKATGSVLIEGRFPGMGHDFAVLSASLAKQCCPDRSAVGLTVPYAKGLTDVVGVVKDSFDVALDQPPTPTLFLPLLAPSMNAGGIRVHYLLRQPTPSANMGMTVDRQLRAIDADVRVVDEGTLNRRLLDTIRDRSFATLILTFFAAAASIVSASGLIGVVGSTVARRTREIAIRISLGANAQQVRLLVTREALVAAASGGIAGLIAGGVLSRFLESLLYGIHPADPLSTAIAALVMLGVVGAAAAVPAKRATSLMPTIALRME